MKENVVLIPGMMLDHGMWEHQVESLSENWNCVVLDYSSADSMEGMADLVGSLGLASFHVIGFSLGAIIAMEVWRQRGAEMRSIALLGFNPRADPAERRDARLAQAARARGGDLEQMMREEFLPRYLSEANAGSAQLADHVVRMALRLGPATFERQIRAQLRRPESTPTLSLLNLPALVMCGGDDRMTSVEQHVGIAQAIPGSQLRVVEGAGHMLTMEKPDAVSAALVEFLSDHAGRIPSDT